MDTVETALKDGDVIVVESGFNWITITTLINLE